MLASRTLQAVYFFLLVLLVASVIALWLGVAVPRPAVAALLVVSGAVRAYRDLTFGGAEGRRRLPVSVGLTLVVAYLILTAR